MQISEQTGGDGVIVLDLEGRFDFAARKSFKDMVERIQKDGCTHIIINMERVTFVDSSALGLLVITSQNLKCKLGYVEYRESTTLRSTSLRPCECPQKWFKSIQSLEEAKRLSPSPVAATS